MASGIQPLDAVTPERWAQHQRFERRSNVVEHALEQKLLADGNSLRSVLEWVFDTAYEIGESRS